MANTNAGKIGLKQGGGGPRTRPDGKSKDERRLDGHHPRRTGPVRKKRERSPAQSHR